MNPITIFINMSKNNRIPPTSIKKVNQKYLAKRREIIKMIRAISTKLNFNSQTFFYSIYYMDIIFSKETTMQKLSEFILIGLNCLSIAAKFNENEPLVPEVKKFISVLSNLTRYRYRFSIDEMLQSEIYCLKMLNYKLNYYSVYHFLVFFFCHGVFFNTFKNDPLSYNKLLEKIYITAREILDYIIEEEFIFLGDDSVLCAVIILRVAMEVAVHNMQICDVFREIYYIDEKKERYIKMYNMITSIYDNKICKKEYQHSLPRNSIINSSNKSIPSVQVEIDYKKIINTIRKEFNIIKIRRKPSYPNVKQISSKRKPRAYSVGNSIVKIEDTMIPKTPNKEQISISQASSNASDHPRIGHRK